MILESARWLGERNCTTGASSAKKAWVKKWGTSGGGFRSVEEAHRCRQPSWSESWTYQTAPLTGTRKIPFQPSASVVASLEMPRKRHRLARQIFSRHVILGILFRELDVIFQEFAVLGRELPHVLIGAFGRTRVSYKDSWRMFAHRHVLKSCRQREPVQMGLQEFTAPVIASA